VRRIVIVGQNLAQASRTSEAFVGTRSGAVLEGWLEEAGLRRSLAVDVRIINVSDRKTPGNRPLTAREMRRELPRLAGQLGGADLVVMLGRQAERAVQRCCYLVAGKVPPGLTLEHPSGRNRNLNDPKVRAAQPERLRRALSLLGT
jgi:uracil-DNA glycosylase family 4